MSTQTYQDGYINGFLDALSEFYNLRFKQKNDYRHTEARFLKTTFKEDLKHSVLAALKEYYRRFSSFNENDVLLSAENIELNKLHVSLNELGHQLARWIPEQERAIVSKAYDNSEDNTDNLTDFFIDFV